MADDVAPAEQDKPTVDYEALLAERGWPPIKGGSPELDEEQGDGSADSPEAPDTGQAEGEESFTDFDPSEIPEDADRDWFEEKYKELRAGFTQKTQEFGETRREAEQLRQFRDAVANPQVAPAVLAQLGYTEKQILEMYGYQPEEEDDDEFADPDQRIDRLEQTLAQREQADQAERYEEEVTDHIAGQIEQLEQKEGREFDPEEHQLLDTYARAYAVNGVPDVEGAHKLLSGILDSRQKQWLESKKTGRPPGGGKPGSRTVDLSKETKEERMARMQQRAEEAASSAA